MLPFRSQPPAQRLPEGYRLALNPSPEAEALNRLLIQAGERARPAERWRLVLERSLWHLAVWSPQGGLVGFVRATSDLALNANLWDLLSDPADPGQATVLQVLVQTALQQLRRELAGCSISLSAPPEALRALEQVGFVVDPGGIRAMGLPLG
ncbi:MAG: N-acetyltransferase [Cyanobacteriota bacterium]|nr:N-acetyltransferase [Cyanobacteriota bacterium]